MEHNKFNATPKTQEKENTKTEGKFLKENTNKGILYKIDHRPSDETNMKIRGKPYVKVVGQLIDPEGYCQVPVACLGALTRWPNAYIHYVRAWRSRATTLNCLCQHGHSIYRYVCSSGVAMLEATTESNPNRKGWHIAVIFRESATLVFEGGLYVDFWHVGSRKDIPGVAHKKPRSHRPFHTVDRISCSNKRLLAMGRPAPPPLSVPLHPSHGV